MTGVDGYRLDAGFRWGNLSLAQVVPRERNRRGCYYRRLFYYSIWGISLVCLRPTEVEEDMVAGRKMMK
jgi:hypothetical protein